MKLTTIAVALSATTNVDALLRFSCSQLTVERLDPYAHGPQFRGQAQGGYSFGADQIES